jgi:hypothetical protein
MRTAGTQLASPPAARRCSGLVAFCGFDSHGLRRGLHSFAASRLIPDCASRLGMFSRGQRQGSESAKSAFYAVPVFFGWADVDDVGLGGCPLVRVQRSMRERFFRPSGAGCFCRSSSHGLRRGLHSFAAARLGTSHAATGWISAKFPASGKGTRETGHPACSTARRRGSGDGRRKAGSSLRSE